MSAERLARRLAKRASLRAAALGVKQGLGDSVSPRGLGQAAGGALALFGAAQLAGAAQKTYLAIRKKNEFSQMMEADPELAQRQAEHPEHFARIYNSFRSMNPRFARDPIVAGNYMRQMSAEPERAGMMIVESLRGNTDARMSPYVESFRRSLAADGGSTAKQAMDARLRRDAQVKDFTERFFTPVTSFTSEP